MTERVGGRWAVETELGQGAMGRVFGVRCAIGAGGVPGTRVACKLLDNPALRADFVSEYRLLRQLAHPGFVRADGLRLEPGSGRLFALLECVDGSPLTPGRQDARAALVGIAADLLRALDHLHRHGLVHGDLAPVNVLWRAGAPPKILDLGAGGPRGARAGGTSGVLAYAAPERLAGEALAPAGDLWSLGALLFGLAYGRHPFPNYPATTARSPARSASESHVLDPVLDRLLAAGPERRFPSAASALAELESVTGEALPLVAAVDRGAEAWPYVDVPTAEHPLERAERLVADALAGGRPALLDIGGAGGSGRTRFLSELGDRLAARGIPTIDLLGLGTDRSPNAWLEAALAQLGRTFDGPGRALEALGRAGAAILIDDLDRAPATRALVQRLASAIRTVPDWHGGTALVTVGLGVPDIQLAPWTQADTTAFLEARFPRRRIGARVAGAITDAARGVPATIVGVADRLVARGALVVDSAQIALTDPAEVARAVPSVGEALATLSSPAKDALALMAYAFEPLPSRWFVAVDAALVEARAVVRVGERLTVASTAWLDAGRTLATPAEAHGRLAALWHERGTEGVRAALFHRLEAGDANAVRDAEATLEEGGPALVRALVRRGSWPTDAEVATRAAELLERDGDERAAAALWEQVAALGGASERMRALVRRGRLETRASRFPDAIRAFTEALAMDTVDASDRTDGLAGLARAAALSGELDTAARATEEGLAWVQPGDDRRRAALLYSRALVDWYRGDLDHADRRLEQALTAAKASEDRVEEAAIVTALGLVAHRRGDLARATRLYQDALRLGEASHDEARVLTALQNLGVIHHERGEWVEALDTYRQALTLAEALDQRGRVAQLAGNLGNLWRYLGEGERAEAVLGRGLELALRDQNRHLEALIVNLLGDVAADRQDWALAEARFGEAIRTAHAHGLRNEEIEACLNLARLHLERQSFSAAAEAILRARTSAEAGPHQEFLAQALALEAGLARRRVPPDRESARTSMTAALALLGDVKNPDGRWPIALEAAAVARVRGDEAEADRWAREARTILQAQLDAVPAVHREAFRARRDRHDAWQLTEGLVRKPAAGAAGGTMGSGTTGGVDRQLGWSRWLEVNKRLASEHNVQRLLEYIMDSAILLTGAERGFLLLADDSAKEGMEVRVARNLDQENIRHRQMKISRGIARRVMDSGEPVLTVDAMEDDRYKEQLSVHDLRLRSILCLPMAFRGRVLGAIYLDNRFRTSAFQDDDVRFMEAFADLAAIALDNARLVESLEMQRKDLDAARREVEALNARLADELATRTQELAESHATIIEERRHHTGAHVYENIVGGSAPMRKLFAMLDRLKGADVPVLIEGESGTGKELVARAIHFSGTRGERPFVAINCGAIPAALLESELFGHVRGAFTNATSDKKGLFEVAHTGTLLLDEIGELPLEMQVKLLRVLQSGEIQKVGATRQAVVDVRILAATNRKLDGEVAAGRFREDLFYRLSVVPVVVPPLRERREDIPLLVQHFLDANHKIGLGRATSIQKDALALLQRYAWPGNVRQLEMVLKNASVFAEADTLTVSDLANFPDIIGGSSPGAPTLAAFAGQTLADIERAVIVHALRANRGNKKKTAEQLGIDRRTLYNKLAHYEIAIEQQLKVS